MRDYLIGAAVGLVVFALVLGPLIALSAFEHGVRTGAETLARLARDVVDPDREETP